MGQKIHKSFLKEDHPMIQFFQNRRGSKLAFGLSIGALFLILGASIPAEAQVLRPANKQSEAKTFDPHMATGSQDRVVVEMIFNGLLRYKPGDMSTESIEPDLAKALPSGKMLADGRQEWVIALRPGIQTHPYEGKAGCELTSEDVVYSFKPSSARPTEKLPLFPATIRE